MIRFSYRSNPGKTHNDNQDRWFADPAQGLFLVTDGMANDIAPQVVVRRLPALVKAVWPDGIALSDAALHDQFQDIFQQVNDEVYEEMAEAGELGLGATLVLALVQPPPALIAHIGDSRAYLYQQNHLRQLTRDHSLVERMVDRGIISAEEAKQSRSNGGPTRFLGQSDVVEADMRIINLQRGDQLLLCSDGLTEMLTDEEIEAVFAKHLDLEDTCEHLIDAANDAGGYDNITVLVIAV